MYAGGLKLKVRKLRKESGYTFKEIGANFPFLSKSTISEWTRDILLAKNHKERIAQKELRGRTELFHHNEERRRMASRTSDLIISKAKEEIAGLEKRDLLIAGTALYWAEGTKKSRYTLEVANSDPKLIALMMRFFREILHIPEQKFRCGLMLHPGLDIKRAESFWSSVTGIPLEQFNKTYIKAPKSSAGKMHNTLYEGTVKVRIHDVHRKSQIKGYIESLALAV